MTASSRRGLLAGGADLSVAPLTASAAITAQAHPDAALLALAGRFIAHEHLVQAMPCDAETSADEAVQTAEQRLLLDHKHGLVMQMGELRATTADGITARARCLALHNADGAHSMDVPDDTTGRLLRWLMRDAGALGKANVDDPAASPDAALLAACAAFDELEQAYVATHSGPVVLTESVAAESERDRLSDAQEPLVARMCELRAVTKEGQAARARSLALWDVELFKEAWQEDTGDRLTAAIVRDHDWVADRRLRRVSATASPSPGGDSPPVIKRFVRHQPPDALGRRRFGFRA